MPGAKLPKIALRALREVIKQRSLNAFAKNAQVHVRTILKMAKGEYVELGLVRKVEAELEKDEAEKTDAQKIIAQVAEKKNLTVKRLLTERTRNRNGVYSDAEIARYIAIHIIYKETRLTLRAIAKEVGYVNHVSVIDSLKLISDLMDVRPEIRQEVHGIYKAILAA